MNERHSVQPVPGACRTVTQWMISKDSAYLIGFLEKAFGAKEQEGSRVPNEDGSIGVSEGGVEDHIACPPLLADGGWHVGVRALGLAALDDQLL